MLQGIAGVIAIGSALWWAMCVLVAFVYREDEPYHDKQIASAWRMVVVFLLSCILFVLASA